MKKVLSIILMTCMLLTTFGIYSIPAAAVTDTVWNFDTAADASAWSYGGGATNGGVSNSILSVNANKAADTTSTSYMQSGTLSINIDDYEQFKIKIKNTTATTNATAYFYINGVWNQPTFTIAANMTDYTEYTVNVASYTGTLTKIMFSFGTNAAATSGTMYVDYMKLTNPTEQAWEFNTDGDFQGWTGQMQMGNRTVSGGYYSMDALGHSGSSDPAIYSPSTFNCSATSYPVLKIKLKNATTATSIGAYFQTTADATWSESKKVSIPIAANSTSYIEYTYTMSTNANWTGTFKQFMLAFGE
jgi:hypothetical protein